MTDASSQQWDPEKRLSYFWLASTVSAGRELTGARATLAGHLVIKLEWLWLDKVVRAYGHAWKAEAKGPELRPTWALKQNLVLSNWLFEYLWSGNRFLIFVLICVWCFACICVCRPHTCLRGPKRAAWSHRRLRATMWVLGIEPVFSERVGNALNHWAIFSLILESTFCHSS